MYFIKTKGTNKVPDFVQIRDDEFALVEQIKINGLNKKLEIIFNEKAEDVYNQILNADYEKIVEIKL